MKTLSHYLMTTNPPFLRLRRRRAGEYQTYDGRFTLLLDPQGGGEPDGYGYRCWLVYDEHDLENQAPLMLRGFDRHPTLHAARQALALELAKAQLTRRHVGNHDQEMSQPRNTGMFQQPLIMLSYHV